MQVRPLLPAPRRSKVRFAPTLFFCKNTVIRPLPCSSSSAKRHACFGCSLASALTTPSLRYHLFAVCRLRRFMSQALYRLRRRFLFLGKRHLALSASQSSLCSVGMVMPTSARSLAPPSPHKAHALRGPRPRGRWGEIAYSAFTDACGTGIFGFSISDPCVKIMPKKMLLSIRSHL